MSCRRGSLVNINESTWRGTARSVRLVPLLRKTLRVPQEREPTPTGLPGTGLHSAFVEFRHNIDDRRPRERSNVLHEARLRLHHALYPLLMTEISMPGGFAHQGLENLGTYMDQLLMIAGFKIDFRLFRNGIIHHCFHTVCRANRR